MNAPTPVWRADWIESFLVGGPLTSSPAPYFHKSFTLAAAPVEAWLHITALGLFDAEINGVPVSDHVFSPGWTEYRKRVRYTSHNVTELLQAGENALGVLLGDGWYCGHVATNQRQVYGARPRLLAQLEWRDASGVTGQIVSDASWLCNSGPILEADMLMGESYDARLEIPGWSSPTPGGLNWQPVRIFPPPDLELAPHQDPPVRRMEVRGVSEMTRHGDRRVRLFDVGENIAGRIRLHVRGKRGCTLKIRHAEVLNADGNLYTENLRDARATDVYTLRGGDLETWEPRFTFHGFRYVEISWISPLGDVEELRVEGVVLHTELRVTGEFACSHALLNQLNRNIIRGMKGNYLDIPTDCPQRDERLGWTGDAQAFIRTAAFYMDVLPFFRKWLLDLREAQGDDGAVSCIIPDTQSFGLRGDGGPAWADAALICPWVLWECYADLSILRDSYASMVAYMDYLATHKVKDGIRCHPEKDGWGGFGDWLALDGSGKTDGGTPKDLIGTAFYAHNARILARTAELLGFTEEKQRWDILRREVEEAFRRRFVSPEGLMASGTQTACVLALHFDLLLPQQRPVTALRLVDLIRKNGFHLGTGFVGTPYLLHVLEASGHLDVAYTLLEQESFPSWLFPVKNGATTIWERWDGWTPDKGFQDKGMNSFNHYAYGAVGDWMVSTVAGLEIAEPGYRLIRFKPRPGGSLTHASARLQTPQGLAAISWRLEDGTLHLELTVPDGAAALLDLDSTWKTEAPGKLPPGVHRFQATRRS
jgi:alpha-L-rhamnosidase